MSNIKLDDKECDITTFSQEAQAQLASLHSWMLSFNAYKAKLQPCKRPVLLMQML